MTTDHLVALSDGWTAWRWCVLRSAGFPAATVLGFSASETCAAIARLVELEDAVERERAAAMQACLQAIERMPDDQRKPLWRTLRQLRAGKLPEASVAVDLAALRDREAQRLTLRAQVDHAFRDDSIRNGAAFRALASRPAFREALLWQNRQALHTGVDALLRQPHDATDSQTRQHERLVASYAQRYCVKNDTIGFFGPIGWAQLVDADRVVEVRPAGALLDLRRVHFEFWCIDTLATKLAEDRELQLDLPPRCLPTVRLTGTTLHHPVNRSTELEPAYAAVVAACDGERTARTIARMLAADASLAVTEDEVYEMLDELRDLRVLRWTLEVPTAGLDPERHLRRALDRLPKSPARAHALATLDELEAARDTVARAAGDPAALEHALRALDELFSERTASAATRRAGATYAARTLVFEDTRRAVEVELGSRFAERLGRPLGLLMLSARWYTHKVAAAYLPILRRVYRELRERTGQPRIDYLQFLEQILPQFADQYETAPVIRPIVDELHARWVELLGVPRDDPRPIAWRSEALVDRVRVAFAAPCPGWPEARYHCPDVMVAARDLAAFARGDFACVVNEIHVGVHTFTRPLFMDMHRDPEALNRAREADIGRPLVKPVTARANVLRIGHFPTTPDDIDIELNDARSWRRPDRVVAVAELVVDERDDRLVVQTRDGRHTLDLVQVLEMYFQLASATHFSMLPPLPHTPRVSIDDLIVSRAAWHFTADELAFAGETGVDRFIGARRWARRHALPRFVFARVATELKPCFVDLESPVYVEILARLIKQAPALDLSEMLPAIDQTWLVDAAGQTYASELRLAVVDPEHWRPHPP